MKTRAKGGIELPNLKGMNFVGSLMCFCISFSYEKLWLSVLDVINLTKVALN